MVVGCSDVEEYDNGYRSSSDGPRFVNKCIPQRDRNGASIYVVQWSKFNACVQFVVAQLNYSLQYLAICVNRENI